MTVLNSWSRRKHFQDGCLVRLLNDEGARGYGYYRQQIDFTTRSPFARNYGDYFAGRIVFPIRNASGEVIGIIGRLPDNKGIRWLKQQAGESAITTKSWLYGIDKAYLNIDTSVWPQKLSVRYFPKS